MPALVILARTEAGFFFYVNESLPLLVGSFLFVLIQNICFIYNNNKEWYGECDVYRQFIMPKILGVVNDE